MPGPRRKISYNRELYMLRRRIARIMKVKGAGKKRAKRPAGVPIVDLSCCKYELLRIVLKKNGWEESTDDEKNSHLIWTDMSIGPERLMVLKRGQKINHFFGMLQICRKKSLAQNLATMRKMFPSQYKFFPRSFVLPNQLPELLSKFNVQKVKTFILKPDNGCQGKGVALAQSGNDVRAAIEGLSGSNLLAQKYLANPMLINGYKFDLRIYVLILSCDPLRLYLYREGLVRFCTEKYSKPDPRNLTLNCMHLTNYAVNKHNGKFEFNTNAEETDKGHKWTLTSLFSVLASRGHDTQKLHCQISQLVVMTIIAINPLLVHNYEAYLPEDESGRTCFELLGMDVLLDEKCKPWLLEVNHSPSFSIDTPLDMTVKEALLTDTLRLVHMDPSGIIKMRMQEKKGAISRLYGGRSYSGKAVTGGSDASSTLLANVRKEDPFDEFEKSNRGKFDRIYPADDKNLNELYRIFLAGAEAAFKHSFHMRIKDTIVRVREERRQEEQAKEVEERRKLIARCEMRRKAQRSARLAALAARARLVEKLNAKMQDDMQPLVPTVRGTYEPATPHEKPEHAGRHPFHPPRPVSATLQSQPPSSLASPHLELMLSELTVTNKTSSAHVIAKSSTLYGAAVKHWRPDTKLCNVTRGGPLLTDRSEFAGGGPNSLDLGPSSKTDKAHLVNCQKLSHSKIPESEVWNTIFTKPLRRLSARDFATKSKALTSHGVDMTLPFVLPAGHVRSEDRSKYQYTMLQRYQGKLPTSAAVPKNGNYVRANTISLPSNFTSQRSLKVAATAEQQLPYNVGKGVLSPTITNIMRAQFGLPKVGDHAKWRPSSQRGISLRRAQGRDSMKLRALFSPQTSHTPLAFLDYPTNKRPAVYHNRVGCVDRRRRTPPNIDHVFRERKTFSWLRSPA